MPAIDRLMKKLGYVKLAGYGLVLTPEGRVMSMRPAVLDDGLGGRIVGWQDGDLAAMELEKWEPARPAPKAAVATRVAAAPRPPVPTRPVPVVTAVPTMVVRETSLPMSVAQVPTMRPVPVAASAIVAPEPVVEEDDWEWTIAIARARAAADEAELAASAPMPAPVPAPPRFVAAKTLPIAKVAESKPDPIASDAWPKTEPLVDLDYNDYTSPMTEVVRVARLANTPRVTLPAKATPQQMPIVAAPRAVTPARPMPVVVPVIAAREYPRAKSPVTVIPIPKLPSINNARAMHIAPVVRAMPTPITPAQPRRFAKGTGPYLPKTEPNIVVAPRRDDDTVPGIVLPPVLPAVAKRASRG
jgi:hypothetical protein